MSDYYQDLLVLNSFFDSSTNDMEDMLLLCLVNQLQNVPYKHSRYKKLYYRRLDHRRRRLRDRRIPRAALHSPMNSAWRQLWDSRNDQALITLTGLDFATFNWLADMFQPIHDNYSPWVDPDGNLVPINNHLGRRRLLTAKDCLGLCLSWTRTRGSMMVLQMIFGLTANPISMYLRFGRRILIQVLQNHPYSAVKIPTDEEIATYKAAINERHPNLPDVWCVMDGLKLTLQQAGDYNEQNAFYNGWTHDHYVSSVFVFCPDGTIPICCVNVPGCIHDSQIADFGYIYQKLKSVYESNGGRCVVDSAFARTRFPFLIKSSQTVDPEAATRAQLLRNYTVNAEATAVRQAAEWGMRSIQASFPRLKDRMIFEKFGERRLILKMCVLLYNLRARKVGINQIRNTFMPALDVDANNVFVPH